MGAIIHNCLCNNGRVRKREKTELVIIPGTILIYKVKLVFVNKITSGSDKLKSETGILKLVFINTKSRDIVQIKTLNKIVGYPFTVIYRTLKTFIIFLSTLDTNFLFF